MFIVEKARSASVFFALAGGGIIFLAFAEKTLDFFAFFSYHIFRCGKNTAQSQRGKRGDGEGEDRVAFFSFSFGKKHIVILSSLVCI